MGACCSNEGNMVDANQQDTGINIEKNNNQNYEYFNQEQKPEIDKYGVKVTSKPIKLTKSEDEAIFEENVVKIKMDNDGTNAIYEKYGSFRYDPNPKDNIKRVLKEIQTLENDSQYYGFWNEDSDERDGNGAMLWPDGSRYDGAWKENKANGRGRLIHADGDVYDGEWKDDKAHGKGKYIHQDGAEYNSD